MSRRWPTAACCSRWRGASAADRELASWRGARAMAPEMLREHDSAVVSLVTRRVHERDRPAGDTTCELGHCPARRRGAKLALVAFTELVKPLGVVTEPAAKLVARRHVLEPLIDVRVGLAQSAWPQALDQHAVAIAARRRLVCSLEPDHESPKTTGRTGRAIAGPRPLAGRLTAPRLLAAHACGRFWATAVRTGYRARVINYWPLLGVAVVVAGFALRYNPM